MENQIIPSLCGGKTKPYMKYHDCGYGLSTLLFADGTFVINLPNDALFDYGLLHGAVVESFDPFVSPYDYIFVDAGERPWGDYAENITAIEVASPVKPKDMSYWFDNMRNAETVDLSLVDTSETQFMMYTFSRCQNLRKIDLSSFNTEELISPYMMFYGCDSLEYLDLSNWTFNDKTKFAWYEFYFGTNRTIRNVERFVLDNVDTSDVTDMSYMFYGMEYVSELDLSSFDTSNVTNMTSMFYQFGYFKDGVSLDVSSFDTSKVEDMSWMFTGSSIEELYLCSFSSASLVYASGIFAHSWFVTIYTTNAFTLTSLIGTDNEFVGAIRLVGGMGTVYDQNYTGTSRGKIDGGVGNPGYFTAC